MAARGSFYGLTKKEVDELKALPEQDRPLFLCDTIYERADFDIDAYSQDVDKAWDALHRCLGEFPADRSFYDLDESGKVTWADFGKFGTPPLNLTVLGGTRLYSQDNSWFVHLVDPLAVKEIANALKSIDREALSRRYRQYCDGAWPQYGEEDLDYTWEYFEYMCEFYRRMAKEDRSVAFVADQ